MDTFDKLKDMLVEKLGVDPELVKPQAQLAADLDLNSLELAEFILTCEEEFKITIKDDHLRSLVCVSDVVAFIDRAGKA